MEQRNRNSNTVTKERRPKTTLHTTTERNPKKQNKQSQVSSMENQIISTENIYDRGVKSLSR